MAAKLLISTQFVAPSQSLLIPSSNHTQNTVSMMKTNYKVSCLEKTRGLTMVPRVSSTSTAVVPENIVDVLGEVTIFTATGQPVQFGELLDQNEGVAVVALLRHFGCFCCWELAASLREARERFDAAGVKLIAIGVGTPDKAQLLAERLPFPLDCLYADPDRQVKVFSKSRFDALKKAMKNYTIKATPDDRSSVLQQGGMFVFKGKDLLYARKDEGTGDHAPLDDIFDICCKASVS